MHEQIMGLVRGLFTAIAISNHALVDSILAEANTAGLLQLLLEAVDHRGMCPLHAAADRSDSQMVTALLYAGAPVESAAEDGSTALVLAAGDMGSVTALLNAGAAVAATNFNTVPLWQTLTTDEHKYGAVIAAIAGGGSAQVLQQLLAAVHFRLPPILAEHAVMMAIVWGHQHLLQQLFDAGADRGAALCHAAMAANLPCSASALQILQDLLAAGVPVDSANQFGTTALMWAASVGSVQGVQVLLAAGAAADARDQGGRTALHWTAGNARQSAEESRVALVGLLIQAGVPASLAEFSQDQQQGRETPLDKAAGYGFPAVVRELYRHISADGTAAAAELQGVLGPALRTAVANTQCLQGHADVGQVLLQLGADPLWRPAGVNTYTPLHVATILCSPAVIDMFVQHGDKQQLSTAVMLFAAVQADCFRVPGLDTPPRSVQHQKAVILVQAAVERSDPASVYAALQPGAAASSPVGEYGGTAHLWPRLLGYFAQVMCSMFRGLEDQFKKASEQRVVVQQMCSLIARGIAGTAASSD